MTLLPGPNFLYLNIIIITDLLINRNNISFLVLPNFWLTFAGEIFVLTTKSQILNKGRPSQQISETF